LPSQSHRIRRYPRFGLWVPEKLLQLIYVHFFRGRALREKETHQDQKNKAPHLLQKYKPCASLTFGVCKKVDGDGFLR
jgi:hypothetical protein